MRVEVLGAEWRDRWGYSKKLDIVVLVGFGGASVTDVALSPLAKRCRFSHVDTGKIGLGVYCARSATTTAR